VTQEQVDHRAVARPDGGEERRRAEMTTRHRVVQGAPDRPHRTSARDRSSLEWSGLADREHRQSRLEAFCRSAERHEIR
jgi:hypothetical protein